MVAMDAANRRDRNRLPRAARACWRALGLGGWRLILGLAFAAYGQPSCC
jgi:hypothetical protein